ncbi:ranBP2-type zinc finger protein At1g67325-like [Vicia villosa]|uniref:ranBP2-type zinc finger protein At1g67325-like n=1 Tax=Vicia villosa TaxID=3911 RepID=UPI00273C31C7|nr:ranBP2-type zinc finger protein At1g67325-like [Vicia villosa]
MASSKNDNQASFGSKRPRNDVLQKDGDWICTTCGNLNFHFRIVCNKKYCHAPKPSGSSAPKPFVAESPKTFGSPIPAPKSAGMSTSKPFIAPVKALATEIMSAYNGGVVTLPPPSPPPPMNGIPINFGSIPSYIPYGSYGTMAQRTFGPGSSIQGRSSTQSGSLGDIFVNPMSDINPYGYGFQGPFPWDAGLTTKDSESHNDSDSHKDSEVPKDSESHKNLEVPKDSEIPKDSKSHKRRIEEGDWICPRCENVNFAFRSKCNMKNCRLRRPTPMPLPVFPEGSWSCNKCGNMNYPYRNSCNMKGCGVERPNN